MDISAVLQEYLNEQRREHPELFEQIEKMKRIEESERYKAIFGSISKLSSLVESLKALFYLEADVSEKDLMLMTAFLSDIESKARDEYKFYAEKYLEEKHLFDEGYSAGFGGKNV